MTSVCNLLGSGQQSPALVFGQILDSSVSAASAPNFAIRDLLSINRRDLKIRQPSSSISSQIARKSSRDPPSWLKEEGLVLSTVQRWVVICPSSRRSRRTPRRKFTLSGSASTRTKAARWILRNSRSSLRIYLNWVFFGVPADFLLLAPAIFFFASLY